MTGSTGSCPGTERADAGASGADGALDGGPPSLARTARIGARRWLATALLGLTWLPGIVRAQEPNFANPPGLDLRAPAVIDAGRVLFNRRCAGRCHGLDGLEGFDGPILSGKAYLNPPYVLGTLVTGRPGSAMPSWKGRLSDDDLWKIIAFVSSLGAQARAAERK